MTAAGAEFQSLFKISGRGCAQQGRRKPLAFKKTGMAVMAFAHAAYQADVDQHGTLYRGIYNFLFQFVELLEIDRR